MTSKISVNDFVSTLVGRGIWHYMHSVSYAADNREDIISLYHTILLYNKKIRCEKCKEHSNKYIDKTYSYVVGILKNKDLSDSEVINLFNEWLYQYHYNANLYAGKDPNTFPKIQDVAEFYMSDETCSSECAK